MQNNMHQFVRDYILNKCIYKGEFEGKTPGSTYDWIIDIRKALLNPEVAFAVSNLMMEKMAKIDPQFRFQLCCKENSPLGTALSLSARYYGVPLNLILCREERRSYGLYNRFEGEVQNAVAVIVDEMSNHGKSMKQCFDALIEEDIAPASVAFSVINKSNAEEGRDRYLPKDLTVISLFDLNDFDLSIGKKKD